MSSQFAEVHLYSERSFAQVGAGGSSPNRDVLSSFRAASSVFYLWPFSILSLGNPQYLRLALVPLVPASHTHTLIDEHS